MPFSLTQLFATPGTVALKAPLSMEFSREEDWSGFPCPPPRDLPNSGLNPSLLHCRQIFYILSHQGRPRFYPFVRKIKLVAFPGGSESACNAGDPGWRREWLAAPVFLLRESHGQRSLVGYSPWGHKESGMTERLTQL